jgi:hypothetical protein
LPGQDQQSVGDLTRRHLLPLEAPGPVAKLLSEFAAAAGQ